MTQQTQEPEPKSQRIVLYMTERMTKRQEAVARAAGLPVKDWRHMVLAQAVDAAESRNARRGR